MGPYADDMKEYLLDSYFKIDKVIDVLVYGPNQLSRSRSIPFSMSCRLLLSWQRVTSSS